MATFAELNDKLTDLRERKTILQFVVDHLSSSFLKGSGLTPRHFMLKEDKVGSVPQKAIDNYIAELLEEIDQIDGEIDKILASNLSTSKSN